MTKTGFSTTAYPLVPRIEGRIQVIRGLQVIIDADLATLYGVPTKVLNQAVKRNGGRFPTDFMFQLDASEKAEVVTNCDHLQKLKFSKSLPFAFTEYGAVALTNVLASAQAVEMEIYVVRAFVQLRHPRPAQAGVRRTARVDDTARAAQAAHRVRRTTGQKEMNKGRCQRPLFIRSNQAQLSPTLACMASRMSSSVCRYSPGSSIESTP